MNDYKSLEIAITCLDMAEGDMACFAMHLQKIEKFKKTVDEIKSNIGDLRVNKKILNLELGNMRDAGLGKLESEAK